MKKIVFMGTPKFSVPILQALAEKYDVQAVVTQPDRPVGRKKTLLATPVKEAAVEMGIPVLQPEKISKSPEMNEIIENLKPDLIVTAAYGQFLPQTLLNSPKFGAINVHASLLPKYRGGAPIHYAILKGEKETGITIMYMEKRMDAGDIISQRTVPITPYDDTGSMFEKLSLIGKDLLMETLPLFFEGKLNPRKQNEEQATYSPNITREQEQIDWKSSAEEIERKIRALRPFPGAYSFLNGERIKIWDSLLTELKTDESPGTIIDLKEDGFLTACGDKTVLKIKEVQLAGKRKMSVEEFLRGTGKGIRKGEQFEKKS